MSNRFSKFRAGLAANLEHLELRPQMLLLEDSYQFMCQYLVGYLDGVSVGGESNLNLTFTKWIQARVGLKSNYAWPRYVWHTIGEKDDSKAKEALIDRMREFLEDETVWAMGKLTRDE